MPEIDPSKLRLELWRINQLSPEELERWKAVAFDRMKRLRCAQDQGLLEDMSLDEMYYKAMVHRCSLCALLPSEEANDGVS